MIEQANVILDEMMASGYTLTLRQLYYQFVSRGLFANKTENYRLLGNALDTGRKVGMIDWKAIEDRGRHINRLPTYSGVPDFLRSEINYFRNDLWLHQEVYCEVWVEKEALLGVIERPAQSRRVAYFACKGYASSSALYEAGNRFRLAARRGKRTIMFHLGDHDPSGLDMTRNNEEMLSLYAGHPIEVQRLALNMAQIEEHDPPPNPAKESDSRFLDYQREYGDESWELDALPPSVIETTIYEAIDAVTDAAQWSLDMDEEERQREELTLAIDNWPDVASWVQSQYGNEDD